MFDLQELAFKGAFLIQSKIYTDARGDFHKTVHRGFFEKHDLEWSFAEQFYTISHKDVIRGMHYQKPPHDHVKLIYCTAGEAIDVLLDLRTSSPTFGQCMDVHLQVGDGRSIYVPKGIAHGFRSLKDQTTIMYSVSTIYEPEADEGVLWNSIPYDWNLKSPVISERDHLFPQLKNLDSPF